MYRGILLAAALVVGFVTPASAETSYVGAPSAPYEVNVVALDFYSSGAETYRVSWKRPASNGAAISGYELYVRMLDHQRNVFPYDFGTSPWKKIANFSGSATSGTVTLGPDYQYLYFEFSLVAMNRFGRSHQPNVGWVDVAVGMTTACAVNRSGSLYCWGESSGMGELFSSEVGFVTPRLASLKNVSQIEAGEQHFCAVVSGDVYCWGDNSYGQVAPGGADSVYTPRKVSLPGKAQAVSLAHEHSCAHLVDGTAWCWGNDEFGQLAGGVGVSQLPVGSVKQVDAGGDATCVVTLGDEVRCSGGIYPNLREFEQDLGFQLVTDIAVGRHVACAIGELGMQCMGFGENGEAGGGLTTAETPRLVPDSQEWGFTSIESGQYEVCGLTADAAMACIGVSPASLRYWERSPAEPPYVTSQLFTALFSPVEIENRGPAPLWTEGVAPGPEEFFDYPFYDIPLEEEFLPKVMRDPKMIALGRWAFCGIDTFSQLWCAQHLGSRRDGTQVWVDIDIKPVNGAEDLPGGYGYRYESSRGENLLGNIRLNELLTPTFPYTVGTQGTPRNISGKLRIVGKNEVGQKLRVAIPAALVPGAHVEYLWYRGYGELVPGNIHNFKLIGRSNAAVYQVRPEDAGLSIGVRIKVSTTGKIYNFTESDALLPGEGEEARVPAGWAKRISASQAKLYAKDIVGAGKVSFRLNGREIAWVNALDSSDSKLRRAGGSDYLIRTVNLSAGRNVLEIFIAGERVRRVVYSR
jgi:hypothetical protein